MAEKERKNPATEFLFDVVTVLAVLGGLAIIGAGLEDMLS